MVLAAILDHTVSVASIAFQFGLVVVEVNQVFIELPGGGL